MKIILNSEPNRRYQKSSIDGGKNMNTDDLGVMNLAESMKAKLEKKREQGYGGWDDPKQCSNEFLARLLVMHIEKGDVVDIANFCMMLHNRGADKTVLADEFTRYIKPFAVVGPK